MQDKRNTTGYLVFLKRYYKKNKLAKLMDRPRIDAFYSTQYHYSINLFQTRRTYLRLYFKFYIGRNYRGNGLTTLPQNGIVQ